MFGVVVVGIVVAGAFFGNDEGELPGGYAEFRDQPTACGAEQPDPEPVLSFLAPSHKPTSLPESTVTVTLETSCGDIEIELDPAGSRRRPIPLCSWFVRVLRRPGVPPHRRGFQGLLWRPRGKRKWRPGLRISDEFPPDDLVLAPGMVMMDNVGSGTTGSQFFILTGDAASALNPQFNLLGEVVSGRTPGGDCRGRDSGKAGIDRTEPPAGDRLHRASHGRRNRTLRTWRAIIPV